jgi:hypothetical protein
MESLPLQMQGKAREIEAAELLNLNGNALDEVPTSVLELCGDRLRGLYLASNLLRSLSRLEGLPLYGLRVLDVSRNSIEELPRFVTCCPSLKVLCLGDNAVPTVLELSRSLAGMEHLESLDAEGNPAMERLARCGANPAPFFAFLLPNLNVLNGATLTEEDTDATVAFCDGDNRADPEFLEILHSGDASALENALAERCPLLGVSPHGQGTGHSHSSEGEASPPWRPVGEERGVSWDPASVSAAEAVRGLQAPTSREFSLRPPVAHDEDAQGPMERQDISPHRPSKPRGRRSPAPREVDVADVERAEDKPRGRRSRDAEDERAEDKPRPRRSVPDDAGFRREFEQVRKYVKLWVTSEKKRRWNAAGRLQQWWRKALATQTARLMVRRAREEGSRTVASLTRSRVARSHPSSDVRRMKRAAPGAYVRGKILGNPLVPVVARLRREVGRLNESLAVSESSRTDLEVRLDRLEKESAAQREALGVLWEAVQRMSEEEGEDDSALPRTPTRHDLS